MDVTVAIATFGDKDWADMARSRAMPSAAEQGVRVVHRHGVSLHEARNAVLDAVRTEWIVHLDADDELEPGYFEAMEQGSADLRAPAVRYVRSGSEARPRIPRVAGHHHACSADCLPEGNWMVVGTAVRTELLKRVGGWKPFPVYEDWDAWLRCWLAGASVEAIPDAIYRAHFRADSRNRAPHISFKNRIHREIVAANFPEAPIAA